MFLVVGGFNNGDLDSTELFISEEWTTVGPLPAAMRPWQGLATIANIVYIAGIEYYFILTPSKIYCNYECINTAGGKEVDGENKIDSDAIRWFNNEKEMWETSNLKLGERRGLQAADIFVDYDAKFTFICQYI